MKRNRYSLIVFLILALLVGGLGWTIYAPVRQEHLNHALIVAIKQNNTKMALALLADGADPNSRDEPPQHLSLWNLLLDKLRGKRPAPSTAPTALLLACSWHERDQKPPNNLRLVKALLERGAVLEVKDKKLRTPLLWSLLWDHPAVSRLLIERGADVNAMDLAGYIPLTLAVFGNDQALVRLLLDKEADVNAIGEGIVAPFVKTRRGQFLS